MIDVLIVLGLAGMLLAALELVVVAIVHHSRGGDKL
jgi:hypothetical protein